MIDAQQNSPQQNIILSAVLNALVFGLPDLEQHQNMVVYYRLGAFILKKILGVKASDPIIFQNLKLLFTSVQWVIPDDAKSAALDEGSAIGEMVHLFWPDASNGLDISTLSGDVRFSFALVASCLQ